MDKRWIPSVVGVLEIMAAICALFGVFALLFACGIVNSVPDIQNEPDVPLEMITALMVTLAALLGLGGIVSFIGGVSSIRRRGWIWAVAGGICAFFLMPPLGIFAVILAILGESEYGDRAGVAAGPE